MTRAKSYGLRCPLCLTWYSDDLSMGAFQQEGNVCGNQAMTGPNPKLCSPNHPCRGILYVISEEEYLKRTRRIRRYSDPKKYMSKEDLYNYLGLW